MNQDLKHILFKFTACPLWRISEAFEWLFGFFEQCGNWWEDLIWIEGGPDYTGFRYLFSGKRYRNWDESESIRDMIE